MIVFGSIIVLVIFLGVGWAVTVEMMQHRGWRRRVEQGDVEIVKALIEEALGTWRRARPPKGTSASLWAGVQRLQLVDATHDAAHVSTSAEGEFRTEEGTRVQVTSALDEAIELAARSVDMMLYDVPNLRLRDVRVDVYSTFTGGDGVPIQRPILTTAAERSTADSLQWEALTAEEVLARFDTRFDRTSAGQGRPISLNELAEPAPLMVEAVGSQGAA
jgi:hypothetical protein